jgi:hypothetical protein
MTQPLIWREIDSAPTDENVLLMCDDGTVALGKYGAEKGSFARNGKPLIGVELWAYPPKRNTPVILAFIVCVLALVTAALLL